MFSALPPKRQCPAVRRTGHYGMWAEARPYSAVMPANLITLAHFSDSVATYAPNSAEVNIIGIVPRSASRALMVGFASPALMSRLSRAMISGGVPFGAPTPPMSLPRIPEASRQWSAHPAAYQIDCCQLRQAPAAHRCVFAAAMSVSHRIQPAVASENSIHLTRSHRRIRTRSSDDCNRPLAGPYAVRFLQTA